MKNLCKRGHFKPKISHLNVKLVKDITIPTQYCMLPDFNILCNHSFAGRNKPKYLWGPTPHNTACCPRTIFWVSHCRLVTALHDVHRILYGAWVGFGSTWPVNYCSVYKCINFIHLNCRSQWLTCPYFICQRKFKAPDLQM